MDPCIYLESLVHLGQKFGLETIRTLCEELGDPQRAYPTLLIAGTNGKGSVAAYLDSALRADGLSVGRYTSPHLVRVNERIAIDGGEIGDADLDDGLRRFREVAERLQASGRLTAPPTYFEALTATAFERFRASAVDVAVLEVGMGGRLDATNVADPIVSAIVSIDFDHEAYLGATLGAIAREKAGVMRAGRVTVIGPMAAEARESLEAAAQEAGALLLPAGREARWTEEAGAWQLETPPRVYRELTPLPGAHQRDNLLVAVRVLEAASRAGLPVDLDRASAGLSRAEWPGRLQWIPGDVPMLLDGAHNLAGARALAAHVATLGTPIVLLFGAMRDKAVAAMAGTLFPLAREVIVTQPRQARAASADEILAMTAGTNVPRRAVPDVEEGLRAARERAREIRGVVVVAGSLYLIGEVLASARH
jgi:dihydrofolate synthase / folylpolyglutamate synthase